MKLHPAIVLLVSAALSLACESKQSGMSSGERVKEPAVSNDPVPIDTATGVDLTPNCDPENEFHKLAYPDAVKNCLLQSKIYNFDAEECTPMNKAYFECNYNSVVTEIKDLGLSTSPLDQQIGKGGKLIGCGVTNNGTTIVAQFFYKAANQQQNDCQFTKAGKVVSICFRSFLGGTPPVKPVGEAAERAYMKECMVE